MACPYFMPLKRLESGNWTHPARLPLGGGWSGCCTAPGHENAIPPQGILETFCNLGYASGCTWSPLIHPWDAIRFAVSAPTASSAHSTGNLSAASAPSRILSLLYSCERNHRPVEHGELTFDLSSSAWLCRHPDDRIQKMAECFLESYLRKKA